MLELYKDDVFVQDVAPMSRFTLPNGDVVEPAIDGWLNPDLGYGLRTKPTPDLSITLGQERLGMICSPLQGKLALGEKQWNKILTYRQTATWAEQVIIDSAQEWKRLSENIKFFQYLLGFTDEQVDAIFRTAMAIDV